MDFALLLHFSTCLMMCGVIWIVQIVHYPTFFMINELSFKDFQKFHMSSISYIVMPLMITELLTAIWLLMHLKNLPSLINLSLLILTWISTFLLSVPAHKKLELKRSDTSIFTLVKTNWPRTLLWSARSIALFFFILKE